MAACSTSTGVIVGFAPRFNQQRWSAKEENLELQGEIVSNYTDVSWEECALYCDISPNCTAYTWIASKKTCKVFDVVYNAIRLTDRTSGVKFKRDCSKAPDYCLYNVLSVFADLTESQCKLMCCYALSCDRYDVDASSNLCILKTALFPLCTITDSNCHIDTPPECIGQAIGQLTLNSEWNCVQACCSAVGCKTYTFDAANNTCTLHTELPMCRTNDPNPGNLRVISALHC